MNSAYAGPSGQGPQTTWNGSTTDQRDDTYEPVVIHFSDTDILSHNTHDKAQWEIDAQIAARKAMAKRSSRSFGARVSRTRSRKRDIIGRPAKPTIDTSFTRHKGSLPRLVSPRDNDLKSTGTLRKPTWLGIGRSGTRGKGLGIMKGTPQPESHAESFVTPISHEPQTADTLTPGTRTWMEISPSDRPIPIGISLPSDSLPDLSPYQTTRKRSESDVELVTPSIIITPAAAMKSVWSPDTESDYTSSIYSRGTFNPYMSRTNVPPVPALPEGLKWTVPHANSDNARDMSLGAVSHSRNETLDSIGTAFEDLDYDKKRKDRIMSSGTVFEEDETPLTATARNTQLSPISPDTSIVPTPRRSQGWWNFITTPFEFSRTNSVWTQGARNAEKTPEIPMLPQRFGGLPDSPSGRSTYIWSATEKSPSLNGGTPMIPMTFATAIQVSSVGEHKQPEPFQHHERDEQKTVINRHNIYEHTRTISGGKIRVAQNSAQSTAQSTAQLSGGQTPEISDPDVGSLFSAMSASPVVGTAAIGTVLMPRQVDEQQQQQHQQQPQQPQHPINVNIVIQDRRPDLQFQTTTNISTERSVDAPTQGVTAPQMRTVGIPTATVTTAPAQNMPLFPAPIQQPRSGSPSSTPEIHTTTHASDGNSSYTAPYQFPPPPHFAQSRAHSVHDEYSRASSPVSTSELKGQKQQRQHRKAFNIMDWLPFGRRMRTSKKQPKEKSRRKRWCWGCCCCLLILVLLAVIIPVVVVVTRKQADVPKNDPKNAPISTTPPLSGGAVAPSNWLNLTGYPPIPTGVSTIAQPEAVEEEAGCIQPATAWSCALPKEDQQAISPNKPDQPNLKLEITFENGTVPDSSKTLPLKRAANPVSAGAFIRSLLRGRAVPSASPAVPAIEDYKFLGNTTEQNQAPFEGEETPFFISFLDTKTPASPRLLRRADNGKVELIDAIPPPQLNVDGTAAPANLFPVTTGQPLRLFNRGRADEHYGFFVYYDRSIFLKEITRNFTRGGNPADQDGGSRFDAAALRCTWAQTRFLVQIWTRSQSTKPLLGSSSTSDSDSGFKRPGSFPYPVTVTVDRHGGSATQKMLYCYKMDPDGTIENISENKQFLLEDRGFGGNRIRPGGGPLGNVTGPIDGGSGGCRCQWQNWLA